MSTEKKNKGNFYRIFLTLEGKAAIFKYCHKHKILSISQALNQVAMKYLYEHGFMPDEDWELLQHSRIMKTGADFIEEKRRRIERKNDLRISTETSDRILNEDEETLLVKTLEIVKKCEDNPDKLGGLRQTYQKRAEKHLPHPVAKEILDILG